MIDNWWQTETGWPIVANPRGLEPHADQAGLAEPSRYPGTTCRSSTSTATRCRPAHEGAICIRLPLPPGTLPTLWGDDDRYVASYLRAFDGYYLSGDGGYRDADGYVYVMGRTDDVINVAGHRLSTGSMEAVLAQHPAVAECAVIGAADALKGQVPRGFVVLKSGLRRRPRRVGRRAGRAVRDEIGPVAAFKDVRVVTALPKTRSGKILRKTMRQIADGETPAVPGHHRGRGGA